MKKINLTVAFEDARGVIIDLIEGEELNAVTFISFSPGVVRANHYHERTTQWNYVLGGEIRLVTKLAGEDVKEVVMKKGELFETVPGEQHALQSVGEAELLVFTKGPRGGQEYESDTFRLDVPLIKSELG